MMCRTLESRIFQPISILNFNREERELYRITLNSINDPGNQKNFGMIKQPKG